MLRSRILPVLVLAGLTLGVAVPAAPAEEPAPASGGQGQHKYIVFNGREFDLDEPHDLQEFLKGVRHIQPGEEHTLTVEKPATFLEQWADLGIWTLVVFLVLLFVLGRYAWKPMLEGLHKREESIRGSLEDAERARAEAQRLRDQLQAEMGQSEQRVQQLLDQGRRDAQRLREEMMAQTRAEIQAERERLHREIDMARDQALQQLWAQAADLATAISGKVLRRSLSPDEHRRLVDEALAEMPRTGNGQERRRTDVRVE